MAGIKTKEHDGNVSDFIRSYGNSNQKIEDSFELVRIMEDLTGKKAKMWGDTMIGFGKYHYNSDRSRQEGDWFPIGFSPRKTAISLYILTGLPDQEDLLEGLGKYKKGKGCLYVKKLSDVDFEKLKNIMKSTLNYIDEKWGLL